MSHGFCSREVKDALKRIEEQLRFNVANTPLINDEIIAVSMSKSSSNIATGIAMDGNSSLHPLAKIEAASQPIPDHQRDIVLKLLKQSASLRPGEAYFILSADWFARWCCYTHIIDTLPGGIKELNKLLHKSNCINAHTTKPTSRDSSDDSDSDLASSYASSSCSISINNPSPGIIHNTSIILKPLASMSSINVKYQQQI